MTTAPMRLPPLPAVRDLLHIYKLRAAKNLSQNFLLEPRVTNKIVSAAGNLKDSYVCEVGPGPGPITRCILSRGIKHLTVIEKDKRFQPVLEMLTEASQQRMTILWGDVLSYNMAESFPKEAAKGWEDQTPKIHIIGNLPFNVATPLIIRWLKAISEKTNAWAYGRVSLTLTFQHEVAERIVAPITHEQRCRLSIMSQYLCNCEYKFTIPGKAFVPKPEVDVGVVKFVPLAKPRIEAPFSVVEKVVRAAFSHRQKYCRRGLETLFPAASREDLTKKLLHIADVDGTLRPFQLSIEEFDRLCRTYHRLCQIKPELKDYDFRSRGGIDDIMLEKLNVKDSQLEPLYNN